MSNGRSMRRRISGAAGRSPGKSRRRQQKMVKARWAFEAARDNVVTSAAESLEHIEELSEMARGQFDIREVR